MPFRAAIDAGVATIMTAHVLVPSLDEQRPATLSRRIVTGLLREELGYDGVILSDDLEMKAIAKRMDSHEATVAAIAAGCDAVLMCSGDTAAGGRARSARPRRRGRDRAFGGVEDASGGSSGQGAVPGGEAAPPGDRASSARCLAATSTRRWPTRWHGSPVDAETPRARVGDRLAVVAPASPFDIQEFHDGVRELRTLGFESRRRPSGPDRRHRPMSRPRAIRSPSHPAIRRRGSDPERRPPAPRSSARPGTRRPSPPIHRGGSEPRPRRHRSGGAGRPDSSGCQSPRGPRRSSPGCRRSGRTAGRSGRRRGRAGSSTGRGPRSRRRRRCQAPSRSAGDRSRTRSSGHRGSRPPVGRSRCRRSPSSCRDQWGTRRDQARRRMPPDRCRRGRAPGSDRSSRSRAELPGGGRSTVRSRRSSGSHRPGRCGERGRRPRTSGS